MSSVRSWLQLGALSAIGSRTISFARPKVFLLRTFQKIFLKYPRNQKLAQFIYKVQVTV